MGAVENIITDNLPIWSSSVQSKSSSGRGTSSKRTLYGVKKLRELILDLAVRGLLVPQDPNDESASVLLEKIADEKEQLVIDGKVKKAKKPLPIENDDISILLPNNWSKILLSDASLSITKGTTPTSVGYAFTEIGINFIKIENLDNGRIDLPSISQFISDDTHSKLARSQLLEGDILFSIAGTIGKTALVGLSDLPANTNQALAIISGTRSVFNPNYLQNQLNSFVAEKTRQKARGGAMPNISLADLKLLDLAVPPLAEQHRIVAKVDELMALCDTLQQQQEDSIQAHETLVEALLEALTDAGDVDAFQSAWQRISEHFDVLFTTEHSIDKLKETILQLAVMGKLVSQDPNDEPAGVLLHRIVAEKEQLIKDKKIKNYKPSPAVSSEEMSFELPDGWIWCRVWDVASIITSGSRGWAKYYSDSGAMFLTMGNLSRGSYTLRMKNIRYVSPPVSGEGKRTSLTEGDLLISITGDVGNLGLIPSGFGESYINQHTALLRLMPECKGRFIAEFMRSPFAKYQFDAPQRGIKNSFRLGDVGEMIMALPPLLEQYRIVAKVDELMALCDQLKDSLQQVQQTQIHLTDAVVENAL